MHTDIFSQQKLDPEKYFQSFAHGIVNYLILLGLSRLLTDIVFQFKYFHNEKPLWSEDSDYFLDFDIGVIPYDDANEHQGVNPEEVLKHKYRDEMSLEYWVYDGHTIDDVPNYSDVEPPLNYMYALQFFCMSVYLNLLTPVAQFGTVAWLFLRCRRRTRG